MGDFDKELTLHLARRAPVRSQTIEVDKGPHPIVKYVVWAPISHGHRSNIVPDGFQLLIVTWQDAVGNCSPCFIMEPNDGLGGRVLPSVDVFVWPIFLSILDKEVVVNHISECHPDVSDRLRWQDTTKRTSSNLKAEGPNYGKLGPHKGFREHACCGPNKVRDELSTFGDCGCWYNIGHQAQIEYAEALANKRA